MAVRTFPETVTQMAVEGGEMNACSDVALSLYETVDSKFVSAERAAELLGVSCLTVHEWQECGVLNLRQKDAQRYVSRDDIEALLYARSVRATSDDLLRDTSLDAPLNEKDYHAAIFEARKLQGRAGHVAVVKAQRSAQARAAASPGRHS